LQKTLLNIEGLGRQLDPDLDLWKTAKPYLERWMIDQIGWRGAVRNVKKEAPFWAATLPQLPRLLHRLLAEERMEKLERAFGALHAQGTRRNRLLAGLLAVAGLWLILQAWLAYKSF
jgi:ubiquinone biosynthesis protein